jgi:glycosyltransferase involved in cell wall biosynthesis
MQNNGRCIFVPMQDVSSERPRFSIITVCFNSLGPLQRTTESLASQVGANYEHVIIDGGSTDGTQEWLAQQNRANFRWISQKDDGLYDAMNKGLERANGEYVWFVNAGDLVESPHTIQRLGEAALNNPDILYGEVLLFTPDGRIIGTRSDSTTRKLPDVLKWQDMKFGMVVSHQAFIPKRRIAPHYMEGNLCADIDWVINCLKRADSVVHTHQILARFETGGLSTTRHQASIRDRYFVLQHHFGILPNFCNHIYIIWRALLAKFTRAALT